MANPQLGYGTPSEASIDAVNQWMRTQPWWSQIRGGNSGDLSQAQRDQILRAAQQAGVVIDEGDMEIDRGGNINPKGHKLRNTLLVAGIAGATLATMGAAGAFAGGAAGAGAGGGAAAGAGAGAAGAGAGATAAAAGAGFAFPTATALSAGASLFGSLYATRQNGRAAQLEADAVRSGAALQDAASRRAEEYTRGEADYAKRSAETNRHADYDMWAARERRLGSVGELVGMGPREIPAYTPLPAAGGSGVDGPQDPAVAFIRKWQNEHNPSEGIAPLSAALKAAGLGGDRFMYGQTPSDNELVVGGQKFKVIGAEKSPGAYWFTGGDDSAPGSRQPIVQSVGAYLGAPAPRYAALPITPALSPSSPYRMAPVGAYL